MKLIAKQISSLEKIFPAPVFGGPEQNEITILQNEEFSYQVAYTGECSVYFKYEASLSIETDFDGEIRIYSVKNVPSELPCYYDRTDEDYLTKTPGLFPDALIPLEERRVEIAPGQYKGLWINVIPADTLRPGAYTIRLRFFNEKEAVDTILAFAVRVLPFRLPPQSLIYTQWIHGDCIADIHGAAVFSEEYWALFVRYVRLAAENGVNMILTPVFTPPLDTDPGGERPTVQLVEVCKTGGAYTFGFARLKKFITLCREAGIRYFEISHLFTQWGAKHAPKIMVYEEGAEKRLFGWDTDAAGQEYREFLQAFLPELVGFLRENGLEDRVYFHISDEPEKKDLEHYCRAKEIAASYLKGFQMIDAMSDVSFYEQGICETPIPALDHAQAFIQRGIQDIWVYYCSGQCVKVSNRLFDMPSRRNRIIGVQLYWYGVKGFLHWGYNFYYSNLSKYLIDPYSTTDAGCAFPSGDAFSVYPYGDGPVPSLRLKVFYEALQDMRLLELLEASVGREQVLELIRETAGMEITFEEYPREELFFERLRNKVFQALQQEK